MPKVVPNDIRNECYSGSSDEEDARSLYECLKGAKYPENELKSQIERLRGSVSSKTYCRTIGLVYRLLEKDDDRLMHRCAEYLMTLYGGKHIGKYLRDETVNAMPRKKVAEKKTVENLSAFEPKSRTAPDERVNLQSVVDYVLNDCMKYEEAKAIYDMLVELMDDVKSTEWTEAKKKIRARMKKMNAAVNIENVNELVMEKHVQNEVSNVEKGGTGISVTQE